MRKVLLALLLLTGCAPARDRQVRVELRNRTRYNLRLKIRFGFIRTSFTIPAGLAVETKVDRYFPGGLLQVDVVEDK